MKSGSLVVLKEPFVQRDYMLARQVGITKLPIVGPVYEVDHIKPSRWGTWGNIECIVLKEFPELEEKDVDMRADAFVEIVPPLESILSEVEEETKQTEICEPAQLSLS